MKKFLLLILFVMVIFAVRWSLYTVDAAEYAYVTILGRHVDTFDGGAEGAGLHFGWPWPIQNAQRLDRRLQQFDLPLVEVLTRDAEIANKKTTIDKRILTEAYVCWKIADSDAVDLFVRRIGTPERARAILENRINSQLGAAIGQMQMDDLISTKVDVETGNLRVDETVARLRDKMLAMLRVPLRNEYGIELVDLRLRRFNHPPSVRTSIFERIRSERAKKATEYESEGKLKARKITSDAEEAVRSLLAQARSEEERIKGRADSEAISIRNQAQSQDPEFYAFLKKMEKLQSILGDNKTVLLLSTHRPLFEQLFTPPRPLLMPSVEKKVGQP